MKPRILSFPRILSAFALGIVLLGWVSCSEDSNDIAFVEQGSTGIAGSYARFLTIGDYLYIVDDTHIRTFSTEQPEAPQLLDERSIGERIESLYHLNGRLFIGSITGLYLYTIGQDGIPRFSATYDYSFPIPFCGGDPVVANDSIAFVTLHTQTITRCGSIAINELKVFDIRDFENPVLLRDYPMFFPKGLALDGDLLFLCDDAGGLKVFDVSEPEDIQLIKHFKGMITYDAIPLGGLLMVVGPTDLFQFDYSQPDSIQLISSIEL